MITLHYNNTSKTIYEDSDSYRYRAIMQKTVVTLRFSLPEFIEFPIGTSVEFEGHTYKTKDVASFKKEGERRYNYTLMFYDETADLEKYKLRDTIDRRVRFIRCARPKEYIDLIVANLNQREPGWKAGSVIDAAEKTIAFDHTNVLEALQKVADEFNTEWEIESKTISLRKVEYFKEDPLPLSYGKGNGFVPGVGRTTQEDERAVEILMVQGGDRNIDRSKYGSKYLLLPKSKAYTYEGRTYISDADGLSIKRQDKPLATKQEDSLDLSDIYPSRVGEVSEVFEVDKEKNYYDFTDKTIPPELDYNACLIEGESMTVSFLTGMLAGDDKQFECKYNHEQRRWQIVPQEIDGITMPGGNYIPRATDTYAVFGIQLPDPYICNDTDKTGASWDMMKEACRHLYDKETPKFTFTGELQGLWAKKNWMRIGGRMRCGSYILFSDTQFVPDGVAIRITGIKDYLSSPKTPIIELSNTVSGSSISSEIDKIKDNDIIIEDEIGKAVSFTKRRFRDALETMDMLEGAMLENFTNRISPIAIETMAMLVGDERLQFRFVDDNLSQVSPHFVFSADTKQMTCPQAILQHLTLGVKDITSDKGRDAKKYKKWSLPLYVSPVLTDPKAKFYLYAKCSTTAETGEYILSQAAHKLQEGTNYYFLVGILNSEYDGERSFVTMYGFTEILPGRITTDRVVTPDASSFFDLVANAFKLGDALSFNIDGDRKLRLRGTLIQSASGQESFISCFRGAYNPSATYYAGDEVTFADETGLVSSYRYKFETPSKGVAPTNQAYWEITARGSHGKDGKPGQNGAAGVNGQDGTSIVWKGEFASHPENPKNGWAYKNTTDKKSYVYQSGQWYQMTIDGVDGINGKDGKDGKTTYTWIRYADDANGNGLSDSPIGKEYIGLAHNKLTPNESSNPRDYSWSKIQGTDGVPGAPGKDGKTTYTWIAYSDNADGSGMYQVPHEETKYIGIATNKETSTEGNNPKEYTWSKFKGDQGIPGHDGLSIIWKGDLAQPPANPEKNWVYRDTDNGRVYIYNGVAWALMVADGHDGINGANGQDGVNGQDGLSVYITYHDNATQPALPTGDGTTGGWHTNATAATIWMSQKVAASATEGSWGVPIKIRGTDGQDGFSPACIYRGNYDDGADYYGTPYRVDAVKAGARYYVAKTDAGAPFNRVAPPDSRYWQDFGAQFDNIATGLLLAEGANIANFIFANQRMESQGKTNGVPNIILDGLRNYASFAAGKVHFDRDIAKIAWLEIVGNDIVGYDTERNVRLRISNTELPSVNSLSSTTYLDCQVETDADAIYDDYNGEVTRPGWREEIRDDWSGTTVDEQCTINTDLIFTIDQDNTMVDLDFQAGVHASIRDLRTDESISVYEVPANTIVATTDTARLTTKLKKGKYRARLYVRFNSYYDWRADMSMQFRPPMVTKWAQQTYIGNNGILVTGGGNYLKQSNEVFEVSVGNNGLKITSTSAQKQINGKWSNL